MALNQKSIVTEFDKTYNIGRCRIMKISAFPHPSPPFPAETVNYLVQHEVFLGVVVKTYFCRLCTSILTSLQL